MPFRVRSISRADTEDILQLVHKIEQAHGLGADFFWPQDDLKAEVWSCEGFGAYSDEGALAAFVLFRVNMDIWEISVLATDIDYRRQRAMEQLMVTLIDAKGRVGEIWLEVHIKNVSAQKLYEKLGFSKVGERPRYYRDQEAAYLYSYRTGSG